MKNDRLITIGLILILCLLVVFLRVNILSLSHLNKLAQSEVYKDVFEEIKQNINKEYVDLPQQKKDAIAEKSYNSYLRQNRQGLQEKIKEKTKEKKAFYQNDSGYTYLFGIDSYYWLRFIDNLIHKGHIGESVRNGQDYDELVDMPIEKSLSRSMHLILGSLIYKALHSLKLNIDYEIGLYLIPLILSLLLAVITFFITRLLSQSNIAAFFASIIINLSPLLLERTMQEWLDTDIYNVFFPLLIFGAFLFVFQSPKLSKKIAGLIVFCLSCTLYASVWQGWWYIFDLLILCGLVFILNDYFSEGKDKASFKKNMLWLLLLFIGGVIFVGFINGKDSFLSFISEPRKLISTLKDVPRDNWPNIFLTVAELKKVAPYTLAEEVGSVVVFFVAIIGSIYLVLFKKIMRSKDVGIGYFSLFIWLGALYYTSLNAIRLALLLIVPLGLMFGIVVDICVRKVFSFSLKFSRKIHFAVVFALIIAMYVFLSFYVRRAIDISYYKIPLMNDAWDKSLSFIKNDSPGNAIINSWWDYGHWFTQVAKRRVLFDGKTQNNPVSYWMAKALISDDEDEAIGILRMLNISKNKAFELLDSYGFSHAKIISVLGDILKLKEVDTRTYLRQELKLDDKKIDGLITLLYTKEMPTVYFITSFDMMVKIRAISHIGNWDFEKGDIWLHLRDNPFQSIGYLTREYSYPKEKANSLLKQLSMLKDKEALAWISRIDTIYPDSLSHKFKDKDDLLIFDSGLIIDLSNYNAYTCRGPDVDIGIPYSVVYVDNGEVRENVLSENNISHSVVLFKESDSYKSILMDKDLAKSMFSRMYFLKGEGLKYFKKVYQEKTPEENYIFVYKIEWPQ